MDAHALEQEEQEWAFTEAPCILFSEFVARKRVRDLLESLGQIIKQTTCSYIRILSFENSNRFFF